MLDVARGSSLRPLLWAAGALAVGVAVAVAVSTPWVALEAPPEAVVASDPDLDFTPAEQGEADAYRAALRPPAYLALGLALAATVAVGFTPVGARLVRALPAPRWGRVLVPGLVGGALVLLGVRLLTLPLSAWQESARRDYGLSTRDWGEWWLDIGRGFAVQSALTLAGVLAIVLLARRWPRRWWVVAAPAAAGFVVVASLTYPLVVEPVFNRFEPLEDEELRASLVELAARDGVTVGEVLVADASRRTTTLNAYVSGFGPTKRVVLYDTLLESAPRDEIEIVVAHELAHARENDVLTGTLLGAGGAALAVLLIALAGSWRPLTARAGLESRGRSLVAAEAVGGGDGRPAASGAALGAAAAVPFVLACVTALGFVSGPGQAVVSRAIEARADAVALDLTRDAETFVRMQHTLATASLADLDPPPLLHWWFASHPTAPDRIAMARTWAVVNDVPVPPLLVP